MMTIDKEPGGQTPPRAPALRIRALRELYGDKGLTEEELANLAGMAPELVRAYEVCYRLPRFFVGVVRLAAALQVPVEDLIAGPQIDRQRRLVAMRRASLEGPREAIGFRCRDHDD